MGSRGATDGWLDVKAGESGMVLNKTVLNTFFKILAEEFIIIRQGTYCAREGPRLEPGLSVN